MYLKKNDKIILLVGVVIIIIAGVGIAMYNVEDADDSNIGEDDLFDTYSYYWDDQTMEKSIFNEKFVGKSEIFEDSFTIQAPANSILTRVELTLSWMDDVTYRGLLSKGHDTLTMELSYNSKMEEGSFTYEGNESYYFNINSMPDTDIVKAESQGDAEDIIEGIFSGQNTATFDIKINVQTGEKFWRILKRMQDKGNDFDLTASYTYYTYALEMENNDDDDMKETGDDDSFNHKIGEFYINLGYGRGMI
jgi:hypothetical protein